MNDIFTPEFTILPNKSRVIFQKIPNSSVVAIQTWVLTGSSYENKKSQAGIAHVIEHMIFKGSQNYKAGELAGIIEQSGGSVNAWTSFDETVFHAEIPLLSWKKVLNTIVDSVLNPLFDETELEREKKVILEEIEHGENSPYHRVSDKLFKLAYQDHPYAFPIIGTIQSVSSFTKEDLINFHKTWYQPQNITYIITGDLNFSEIVEYLSSILPQQKSEFLPQQKYKTIKPNKNEVSILHAPFNEAYVSLAIPLINKYSYDTSVYDDLLSTVLGDGESSRLVKNIKYNKKFVLDVYAYAFTPKDAGLFTIGAILKPENLLQTIKELKKELYALYNISEAELKKAKLILKSDDINQLQTAQGIAKKIGFFLTVTNDIDGSKKYINSIDTTKITDLQKRLNFLIKQPVYLSILLPEKYEIKEQDVLSVLNDTFALPDTSSQIEIKTNKTPYQFQNFTLSNGIKIISVEDHSLPIVSIRAGWKGGLLTETSYTSGVSPMLANMLTRGTIFRNANTLHNSIELRGGTLIDFSGRNSLGLRLDTVSEFWEENLEYLLETLKFPAFDQNEFEIIKDHALENLKTEQDQHSTQLLRLFEKLLYGKKHPYGLNTSGNISSLSKMTIKSLKNSFNKFYSLNNLVIAVVGDIDSIKFKSIIEQHLDSSKSNSSITPKLPLDFKFTSNKKFAYKKRDISQNYIICGVPAVSLYNDERFVLDVISRILSGQSGRLFLDLRDKQSLAYSVRAFSLEGLAPGYFATYIVTSPQKSEQAIAGILKHYENLRTKKVSQKELNETINYMKGIHDISLQYKSAICASVFFGELYDIGYDSFLKYKQNIEKVSSHNIIDCSNKYLDARNLITAVYGPQKPVIK